MPQSSTPVYTQGPVLQRAEVIDMRTYHRMTWTDRLTIEKLYNSGSSYRAIASAIGYTVAAVHREVKRGLYTHLDSKTYDYVKRYSAQIADDDARYQATSRCGVIKLGHNHAYAQAVADRILSGESPDSVVGSLRNKGEWTVSTPTLYRYIDSGYIPNVTNKDLIDKSHRKRAYNHVRASRPPAGTSIEKRPQIVLDRSTFGHWEMDCVIGKAKGTGEALLVLTERFTRYEIIFKLSTKAALPVNAIVESTLSKYPKGTFETITVDNGSEFSSCYQLPVPVYYCHPYSSYERGSNENCNRLIRRYFPKGQSMSHRTQVDADKAAHAINSMHRKILGYRTAQECFDEQLALLTAK